MAMVHIYLISVGKENKRQVSPNTVVLYGADSPPIIIKGKSQPTVPVYTNTHPSPRLYKPGTYRMHFGSCV